MKHFNKKIFLTFVWSLLLTGSALYGQRTLTGRVTDVDNGEALIGASVIVKGTTAGAATDADGKYTLRLPEGASQLRISYTGYSEQTIAIGASDVIDIQLSANAELEEVLVIGYGSVKKEDKTGSVNAVTSEDFNGGAVVSPEQLIAGKIAGVQISSNGGEPGGGITVRIRGGTSVGASNEPLYVIDGVPIDNEGVASGRNPLNFLNPNEIESYTVLKDASAAAIYGSRGANGVIIITTKKGKKGSPGRLTYDGYFSTTSFTEDPPVLSSEEFRNVVTFIAPNRLEKLGDASTNWFDEITQTAGGQNHSLAFTGGSENISYRASVGYQKLEGVLRGSETERTSYGLNYNHTMFSNKLNINMNLRGAFTKDLFDQGQIGTAWYFDPTQPVYDETNTDFAGFFEYGVSLAPRNPVSTFTQIQDEGKNFRNLGNIEAEYKLDGLIDGLSAKVNLGFDASSGKKRRFVPTTYANLQVTNFTGEMYVEDPNRSSKLLETYLTYKKLFADVHRFELMGGYSWQDFNEEYPSYRAYNLSSNAFGFNSTAPAANFSASNYVVENRLISFFGRANYSFREKYLLTATLRRDGSSRFGPDNRWGTFPSAAFAWRILEEGFSGGMRNIFSDLKLRVGWGVTGNQSIPDYGYIPTYAYSDARARYQFGYANGEPVYVSTARANGYDAGLKWEETTSTNIGLDFGFWNGRLNGTIEYYVKNTNDLLFTVNIPAGTNLTDRILTNIGELENKGIELTLDAGVIKNRNFSWNVSFNMAANKNKVLAIDQVSEQGVLTGGISGGVGNYIQILQVGQPVNSFYVFQHKLDAAGKPLVDGIDHNDDGAVNLKDIYEDLNGDGAVSDLDKRPYEKPAPDLLIGVTSQMNFKNFDFNFTLRGSVGNYVYNNNASNGGYYNIVNERGDIFLNNMHTSGLVTGFQGPQYFSDYYVEDGSFLRVDNATLGYTFPKMPGRSSLRVYVTVQNPFLFTKYSGIDPEVSNRPRTTGETTYGIDNNPYPRSKGWLFGVSVGL
ncbi:MAG TPA: TonB-dependent receptor [Saprospiraceae bacterium]|nr:TonB-dependent receptor [Saprospiraceae bacterium]